MEVKKAKILIGLIFFLIFSGISFSKDISLQVRRNVKEAIDIRQKAQEEEDRWFEERKRLEKEYKKLQEENKALSEEVKKLNDEIASHKRSIKGIKEDISEIDEIRSKIEPLILGIYKRLCEFVEKDIPFLPMERENRLKRLRKMIGDPNVDVSEKFRSLMEAIFIEARYGNTIEVYRDRIKIGEKNIYANIFRFGRVSLFFETLDGKRCGYFDPSYGWRYFPKRYNKGISDAIEIAEKRRPAEIIDLPIGRIMRR